MRLEMGRSTSPIEGNVLRIEKTSIHDGEGLRTVVFLKGCPLKCLWCSTPESQKSCPEIGYISEKCILCGICVSVCPQKALSIDEEKAMVSIDRDKCDGCMLCVKKCPSSALKGYGVRMPPKQVIHEISKDEVFYFHSGGGVTISGGEPFDQAEFVREILIGCRERGINRALETSFFSSWEKIESILPLLNLLYVDLKHADPEQHKKLTGVDNRLILENIKRADASPYDFDLVIRTPLIPGLNDSDDAIRKSAEFIKGLKKIKFMEFLAYHRLGTETYKNMGLEYPLQEIKTPNFEFMKEKAKIFQEIACVPVRINGIPLNN